MHTFAHSLHLLSKECRCQMFYRCMLCCSRSFIVHYWLTRPSPSVSPAGFRGSSSQRPYPFLLSPPAATGHWRRTAGLPTPTLVHTTWSTSMGKASDRRSEAARVVEERLGSRRIRCRRARAPPRRLRRTPCGAAVAASAAGAPGNADRGLPAGQAAVVACRRHVILCRSCPASVCLLGCRPGGSRCPLRSPNP